MWSSDQPHQHHLGACENVNAQAHPGPGHQKLGGVGQCSRLCLTSPSGCSENHWSRGSFWEGRMGPRRGCQPSAPVSWGHPKASPAPPVRWGDEDPALSTLSALMAGETKEHSGEAGSQVCGPRPRWASPCLCFADRGRLYSLPKRARGNQLEPPPTPTPSLSPPEVLEALAQGVQDALVLLLVRSLTTVGSGDSLYGLKTSERI